MTLLDLKNLVAFYVDDLNFGYFTETQVKVFLNNAQGEVQKILLQSFENWYLKCVQTTMVANQNSYVLPENFLKCHRLEIITSPGTTAETSVMIEPITLNQQDFLGNGPAQPIGYFLKRNRIVLHPTPDTTYVMRLNYSYRVSEMTLNTDIPDIPEEYHELIALNAAYDCMIKDGRDVSVLDRKMKAYEEMMKRDSEDRKVDRPRMVTITESETGSYGSYF